MLASINMAAKFATLFAEFANACQREHLETAAIGQHRAVEAIETVQTACLAQYVQPRTQVKVVGIAQNNLRLYVLLEFVLVNAFDTA